MQEYHEKWLLSFLTDPLVRLIKPIFFSLKKRSHKPWKMHFVNLHLVFHATHFRQPQTQQRFLLHTNTLVDWSVLKMLNQLKIICLVAKKHLNRKKGLHIKFPFQSKQRRKPTFREAQRRAQSEGPGIRNPLFHVAPDEPDIRPTVPRSTSARGRGGRDHSKASSHVSTSSQKVLHIL